MLAADVRGKRFSVLGGARSGLAVAGLLKAHGAEVFLSDCVPAEKMLQVKAHLDILGTAFGREDLPYCPKGATGFGVRLLIDYLAGLA